MDVAESMLEAYAACYDEIVQGYENETRITYEEDESCPEGDRILAKEEELDLLDLAYKDMVKHYEMHVKREYIIKKATVEGYKITAFEIARRREKNEKYFGYLSKAKELNQRAEEEKLPWALMEAH